MITLMAALSVFRVIARRYGMGLGIHGGYFSKMFPSPSAPSINWGWDGVNGDK